MLDTRNIYDFSDSITAEKAIFFFSNLLKRWCSQKHCTEIWSFLYYQEIWYFSFLNIWSYSLDRKWKRSFSKKYMKIWYFLQTFWKDGLSKKKKKKSHRNMVFLVLSGKMIFPFSKNMILFFRWKMKDHISEKDTWKY